MLKINWFGLVTVLAATSAFVVPVTLGKFSFEVAGYYWIMLAFVFIAGVFAYIISNLYEAAKADPRSSAAWQGLALATTGMCGVMMMLCVTFRYLVRW